MSPTDLAFDALREKQAAIRSTSFLGLRAGPESHSCIISCITLIAQRVSIEVLSHPLHKVKKQTLRRTKQHRSLWPGPDQTQQLTVSYALVISPGDPGTLGLQTVASYPLLPS